MSMDLRGSLEPIPALEQRWQLAKFRAGHPLRCLEVGGVAWEYIAAGAGPEALLILPGGSVPAEGGFELIPDLQDAFRVIAPTLPALGRIDHVLGGLAALLDAEGIATVHVFGGSFGGLVAQCFVRRYPERVRSLILANTALPPEVPGWWANILRRLVRLAPARALRARREWGIARMLSGPRGERTFWRIYLRERLAHWTADQLRNRYLLTLDLAQRFAFTPEELADWPGNVLILESDHDIVTPEQRAALKECYRWSRVQTFHGAGHTPWLSDRGGYLAAIRDFLRASAVPT
jgi:pimeloyl-ACP methyl ester carboxylesterase